MYLKHKFLVISALCSGSVLAAMVSWPGVHTAFLADGATEAVEGYVCNRTMFPQNRTCTATTLSEFKKIDEANDIFFVESENTCENLCGLMFNMIDTVCVTFDSEQTLQVIEDQSCESGLSYRRKAEILRQAGLLPWEPGAEPVEEPIEIIDGKEEEIEDETEDEEPASSDGADTTLEDYAAWFEPADDLNESVAEVRAELVDEFVAEHADEDGIDDGSGFPIDDSVDINDTSSLEEAETVRYLADGETDPDLRERLANFDNVLNSMPWDEVSGDFSEPLSAMFAEGIDQAAAASADDTDTKTSAAAACADAIVAARDGDVVALNGKRYGFHVNDASFGITELRRAGDTLVIKIRSGSARWELTLGNESDICGLKNGSLDVTLRGSAGDEGRVTFKEP